MKIYGKIGTNQQVVHLGRGTPGDDLIEMQGPRPALDHVAQADGTWLYVEPVRKAAIPFEEAEAFAYLYPTIARFI